MNPVCHPRGVSQLGWHPGGPGGGRGWRPVWNPQVHRQPTVFQISNMRQGSSHFAESGENSHHSYDRVRTPRCGLWGAVWKSINVHPQSPEIICPFPPPRGGEFRTTPKLAIRSALTADLPGVPRFQAQDLLDLPPPHTILAAGPGHHPPPGTQQFSLLSPKVRIWT